MLSTAYGAVLGVEVAPSAGAFPAAFYGFSIGWWVCAACVLALAVGERASHAGGLARYRWSDHVFPVFHFDPRLEDIYLCNRPTLLTYAFFGMALIWCIITIDFGHSSTGLGGAAFVVTIVYTETRDKQMSAARELHDISPLLTNDLLTKARTRAEQRQYSGAQAEVPEPLRSILRQNQAPRKEWLAKVRTMRLNLGLLGMSGVCRSRGLTFTPLYEKVDMLTALYQAERELYVLSGLSSRIAAFFHFVLLHITQATVAADESLFRYLYACASTTSLVVSDLCF